MPPLPPSRHKGLIQTYVYYDTTPITPDISLGSNAIETQPIKPQPKPTSGSKPPNLFLKQENL
jgi:hypothetical protein